MGRITIKSSNSGITFENFDKPGGHGRTGQIKTASFLGRNITVMGKNFNRGSLIDFINSMLPKTETKLRKGCFFGLFKSSSDKQIEKTFHRIIKNLPLDVKHSGIKTEPTLEDLLNLDQNIGENENQKITECPEWKYFKAHWREELTANQDSSKNFARMLEKMYTKILTKKFTTEPFSSKDNPLNLDGPSSYKRPLGKIHWIPGEFSMWMPGLALVATHLSKKKKIDGLHVCSSLESLSAQIKTISESPEDCRHAYVVSSFSSSCKGRHPEYFEPDYPQHKSVVCVEKKNGQLTIAHIDPQSTKEEFKVGAPDEKVADIWKGWSTPGEFDESELVMRFIMQGIKRADSPVRVLHSHVPRETAFGCATFAVQDAIAYLRDPDFFTKITSTSKFIKIGQGYNIKDDAIELIDDLTPEHMIGTQSIKRLETYKANHQEALKQTLIGNRKYKTLEGYLSIHGFAIGDGRKQNLYTTKKTFGYLLFVILSMKYMKPAKLKELINETLV